MEKIKCIAKTIEKANLNVTLKGNTIFVSEFIILVDVNNDKGFAYKHIESEDFLYNKNLLTIIKIIKEYEENKTMNNVKEVKNVEVKENNNTKGDNNMMNTTITTEGKKVNELKAICKELNIKGYSKLKKEELVTLINSYMSNYESEENVEPVKNTEEDIQNQIESIKEEQFDMDDIPEDSVINIEPANAFDKDYEFNPEAPKQVKVEPKTNNIIIIAMSYRKVGTERKIMAVAPLEIENRTYNNVIKTLSKKAKEDIIIDSLSIYSSKEDYTNKKNCLVSKTYDPKSAYSVGKLHFGDLKINKTNKTNKKEGEKTMKNNTQTKGNKGLKKDVKTTKVFAVIRFLNDVYSTCDLNLVRIDEKCVKGAILAMATTTTSVLGVGIYSKQEDIKNKVKPLLVLDYNKNTNVKKIGNVYFGHKPKTIKATPNAEKNVTANEKIPTVNPEKNISVDEKIPAKKIKNDDVVLDNKVNTNEPASNVDKDVSANNKKAANNKRFEEVMQKVFNNFSTKDTDEETVSKMKEVIKTIFTINIKKMDGCGIITGKSVKTLRKQAFKAMNNAKLKGDTKLENLYFKLYMALDELKIKKADKLFKKVISIVWNVILGVMAFVDKLVIGSVQVILDLLLSVCEFVVSSTMCVADACVYAYKMMMNKKVEIA